MFNLALTSILLATSNTFTANPNTTECHECISNINYLKSPNSSIFNILDRLDNVCTQLNFTQCLNFTNQTEQALENLNATKICEKMGYCDSLALENFVMNLDDVYVFTYYNSILGMKSNITFDRNHSLTQQMYLHQVWNITFDVPVIETDLHMLDNYPNLACNTRNLSSKFGSSWSCPVSRTCERDEDGLRCNFNSTDLIKFTTKDHMYYFNISNTSSPVFVGRVSFDSTISYFDWYRSFSNSCPLWDRWGVWRNSARSPKSEVGHDYDMMTEFYNKMNMSVVDSLYNGTVYTVVANWSKDFSKIYNLDLVKWAFNFV